MNYYGPRVLLKDGADPKDWDEDDIRGYHYTRRNDSRVWPLGYCQGPLATTREEWDERMGVNSPSEQYEDNWDSERAKRDKRGLEANRQVMQQFGDKFHDHPHESEEDAISCYTEFVIDVKTAFYHTVATDWRDYFGSSPHNLSRPITGDDIPPDTKGFECRFPGCETVVSEPTARINAAGAAGGETRLCGTHCNKESVQEFYRAPESSMSSF